MISGEGARHKWGLDSGFSHGLDGAARGGGGQAGGACGDDHSLKVQPQLANVVAIDSVDCVGAGPRRSRRQGGGVTHVGNIGVVLGKKGNFRAQGFLVFRATVDCRSRWISCNSTKLQPLKG